MKGGQRTRRAHSSMAMPVIAMAVWAIALLWLAVRTGIQHDYGYYLQQWALVGTGTSPWAEDQGFPPSTYGPLHVSLAPLASLAPLLPKALFVALFGLACVLLTRELSGESRGWRRWLLFVLVLPANLLVIGVVALQGDNDVLVGALTGFALIARHRGHSFEAGVLLGLAVLVKFYPLVFVLFLCIETRGERRRWSWRPLIGAAAVVFPGMLIALAVWGPAAITTLRYAASRPATYLSPLRALAELPATSDIADALSSANSLLAAAALLVALLIAWRCRLTWLEASAVGMWLVLVVYKVGHAQFYLSWLLVIAMLVRIGNRRAHTIAVAFLPFIAFLEAFQAAYTAQSNGWIDGDVPLSSRSGLVTLVMAALTVLLLARALVRAPRGQTAVAARST